MYCRRVFYTTFRDEQHFKNIIKTGAQATEVRLKIYSEYNIIHLYYYSLSFLRRLLIIKDTITFLHTTTLLEAFITIYYIDTLHQTYCVLFNFILPYFTSLCPYCRTILYLSVFVGGSSKCTFSPKHLHQSSVTTFIFIIVIILYSFNCSLFVILYTCHIYLLSQ